MEETRRRWSILRELLSSLTRLPRTACVGLGILLTFAIGGLDYITGPEFGASIFYLPPILLTTWLAGRKPGLGVALTAALVWLWADLAGPEHYRHVLLPYWNAAIRLGVFGITVLLLDAFKTERLNARQDSLTGLSNRSAFFEQAESEVERSRRYGRPLTLAFIDCDDFKKVNDQQGHEAGDALLRRMGELLSLSTRKNDLVARMGGDEFAVLFAEMDRDEALRALENLQGLLRTRLNAGWPEVTVSIGGITYVQPPKSVDEMLGRADFLMYRAKHQGKDTLVLETADPSTASVPMACRSDH